MKTEYWVFQWLRDRWVLKQECKSQHEAEQYITVNKVNWSKVEKVYVREDPADMLG